MSKNNNGESTKKFTVSFTRERETKNTVRFQEVTDDGPSVIGILYVQKFALKKMGDPDYLTVTIEANK